MLFQKKLVGNSVVAANQRKEVTFARNAANAQELSFARNGQIQVNQGLIPRDVYKEFDNVTVERFRSDDGDAFLNDLLPLSRSINIGKLTQQFRRASDAGNARTSMSGQTGVMMDQVEYSYDGAIVPIHDAGFKRGWRELEGMRSEGFDALIDDQRETVATVRRHLADNFLDGHRDNQGNLIVVDGLSWAGMRNDSRVAQVDLGAGGVNFDFTDQTKTYLEIEAAFKEVRDVLWITNKCKKSATYYVSETIMSNFERKSSENYDSTDVTTRLAGLMGVASIKESSKLAGNQLMAMPLDQDAVRPLVGMGLNTIAMPRPVYNDDHRFVTLAAIGFEVRTDYFGNTCALYASS